MTDILIRRSSSIRVQLETSGKMNSTDLDSDRPQFSCQSGGLSGGLIERMHYVRNKRFLDSVYQKLINERRDIDSQLHRHKEKAVGIGEFQSFYRQTFGE